MNLLGKIQKILIEEEITKIDKGFNENIGTISYKIKFIDIARYMESSLSSQVDNPTEGIHKVKYQNYNCFLEYESIKDKYEI